MPLSLGKKPHAVLISKVENLIETVYSLWQASRDNEPTLIPAELAADNDPELAAEMASVFKHVLASDIPVAENLDFVFVLENVPISLREQIVRHRVGHRFGENFGVDIVPEVNGSSWWSQSMRVLHMGEFYVEENFYVPPTIAADEAAHVRYLEFLQEAAAVYRELADDFGIPPEDARQVIPLAASHRISWKINYMSLKHVLGRRGCWIAQLGMWEPLLMSMVDELCTKVDASFRKMILPPCIDRAGAFSGCPFPKDNVHRLKGEDPEPPCPAWLTYCGRDYEGVPAEQQLYSISGASHFKQGRLPTWSGLTAEAQTKFKRLFIKYQEFWGLNPWTMVDE